MNFSYPVPQFWNREELYKDVWDHALTALVSKYGVSAVAIGKTCKKLRIPLPGRGYWAKKAHGHKVQQKPLPKLLEVPRILRHQREVPSASPAQSPKPTFPVEEEDKVEIDRITQMLSAGGFEVKHPRKSLQHPLVAAARGHLQGNSDYRHVLRPPWNEPCLDLRVSKPSLSHALGIMASLIAILEEHGSKIRVSMGDRHYGKPERETSATIFGERVLFGITEKIRQVLVPDPSTPRDVLGSKRSISNYEPTGELSIIVLSDSTYFATKWADHGEVKVESFIPKCVATMMMIAVEFRRNTARKNVEDLFKKLRWEELGRLKAQIESEEARIARLESGANDWHRARRIREYVLAVTLHRKGEGKELGPDTALGKWAVWALQKADRIDPLSESPESVLDRKAELQGWSEYDWR